MDRFVVQPNFPQQVSSDQDSQGRAELAFSSGASFAFLPNSNGNHNEFVSRLPIADHEIQRSVYTPSLRRMDTPQRPPAPAIYPQYTDYSQRLRTYARWTSENPGPTALTGAGFFFTNKGDLVRCYQCGIGLKDFSAGDDPLLEHARHAGDCLFLLEKLGQSGLAALKTKCSTQREEWGHNQPISQCRHPEYMTIETRISSFNGWPSHMIQTPAELAEAGLYYTGVEDHVRCFMCDGGLRKWNPEDNPWIEHCRWFPECPYAKEKKGDEFIALVQASAGNDDQETEHASNNAQTNDEGLYGAMERLGLRNPDFKAVLKEHIDTCLEIGYLKEDVNEAVEELGNMGNVKPTIEEVIDMVEVVKERQKTVNESDHSGETLYEENKRLKKMLTCMQCRKNDVNALFLPCTHHRLCMECAGPITRCPECDRHISQKIKTYLV